MSLVPVHGGLDAPVNRTLKLSRKKELLAESASLPKVVVASADLATVYRIADGTLSPLTGPMSEEEYHLVLNEKAIVSNGERYAWTIPTILPVTDDEASKLRIGGRAALVDESGTVIGVLDVQSVYEWDKAKYVQSVYGTSRMDHPGGAMVTADPRTKLVGGEVQVLPPPQIPGYGHLVLTPRQTRALFADRQYERTLAFQTRNPLHRAHEYALVYGAEVLTRQGFYTGVVLNPLVGQLKGDDVDAPTRMRSYRALVEGRLLGQGDSDRDLWESVGYDLNDVFHLVALDIKMFYGGPSEAVMHAIYRQNLGFTNLVIGRKHADAPYFDNKPIWGDFDAQTIFDHLGGNLEIKPVNVGFAAYYESIGRVDLMEKHDNEKPFFISGSAVRATLVSGQRPDARIMRPSTADILIEAYRAQA